MLNCHVIETPDAKMQVVEPFLSETVNWIVSDLESKFWMQSLLRTRHGIVGGDPVLRVSEFWQKILLQIDPEWQILQPQITQLLIEKWASPILKEYSLNLSVKDSAKAYQTMAQILPLLSHFAGAEAIEEWFSESGEAKERWFDWYLLSEQLWKSFLNKKMIPIDWIKGTLLSEPLENLINQPLVFDLGIDIDDIESELILNLSRNADVHVIVPHAEQGNEIYDGLLARCQPKTYQTVATQTHQVYGKFPSMLAEVKQAVSVVRGWLEQGLLAHEIAIVSPILENYWPTLNEYLEVEGILTDKATVAPLSQFEVYQTWLSKMRLSLNKVEPVDGQQIVFSGQEQPELEYHQYMSLFANVYQLEDFQRHEQIKKQIPTKVDPEYQVCFSDFLNWSFELMEKKHWDALVQILPDFDDLNNLNELLSYRKWYEYLEFYLSRTEKKITPGVPGGLLVLSPSAALNRPLKKIFVMGLAETNMTETQKTALQWGDIESIKIQFGFNLPHADRFNMLEKMKLLSQKNCEEIHFSIAETDFSGQFQSPSLFWLQGAMEKKHSMNLDSPQQTRWDLLMQSNPRVDLEKTGLNCEQQQLFVQRDMGLEPTACVPLTNLSLSASSFEEYHKCPFRFFAQKGLNLSELPSLDLDLDYMTRGRLIHKICEMLLDKNEKKLSMVKVDSLVEKAKQAIDMPVYNGPIWDFLKPLYIELTKTFIAHEIQWRSQFPKTQTLWLEKFIETKIKLTDEGFVFSESGQVPFRGIIDRIDGNGEGQYVILDYKTTKGSLRQYTSWLKNGQLQLALYSLALMEGALDGEKKDIVGAFYYIIKGIDRSKGFVISEADEKFLASKKMSRQDLETFLSETKKLVGALVQDIVSGVFAAKPREESLCDTCDWRDLCRYPALNQ